jgi:hypothetical protein
MHFVNVAHMKPSKPKELLTLAQAVALSGISRRTLQRRIKTGELSWHGGNQRGRFPVAGLSRPEVMELALHQPSIPLRKRVERDLTDWGFNPKQVLGVLLAAALDYADIDMLTTAIRFILLGNTHFVKALTCSDTMQSIEHEFVREWLVIKAVSLPQAITNSRCECYGKALEALTYPGANSIASDLTSTPHLKACEFSRALAETCHGARSLKLKRSQAISDYTAGCIRSSFEWSTLERLVPACEERSFSQLWDGLINALKTDVLVDVVQGSSASHYKPVKSQVEMDLGWGYAQTSGDFSGCLQPRWCSDWNNDLWYPAKETGSSFPRFFFLQSVVIGRRIDRMGDTWDADPAWKHIKDSTIARIFGVSRAAICNTKKRST